MISRLCGLMIMAVALSACGGGGGGTQTPSAGTQGTTTGGPTQPPSPPPVSTNPVMSQENPTQKAIFLHPFSYDVTQGGKTFSDPAGGPLTYTITIGHVYNPYNDPNPPQGLHIEGTRIVGAPREVGVAVVFITAKNIAGNTVTDEFNIIVSPNTNPNVAHANDGALIAVGSHFDYDAGKSGSTFVDADGDALTYEISLRGQTAGIATSGTHVTGSFPAVGLVEVTITAKDAYGGSGSDVFTIAAPAPDPGRPSMPSNSGVSPSSRAPQASSAPYVTRWSHRPTSGRPTTASTRYQPIPVRLPPKGRQVDSGPPHFVT
jgi:hypothetical protein